MSSSIFDSGADPLAVLSQDNSGQRAQIAQYTIMRAAAYLQKNDNEGALKEFKKALAFDSQNTTAQNYIGKINLALGNTGEAIKMYKTMVQAQPFSVDAHINLANAYLQDKNYTESEKELLAAQKLDPNDPLPPYTLGMQYANTDRPVEAEMQFLKAKKISPSDGNVYYALGMVYNKQGKYEDAAKSLEKSLSLKKKLPAANYELGLAYDRLGRPEDAQKQLSLLQSANSFLVKDLETVLNKPKILSMDTKLSGGFLENLGPGTPLWAFDPTELMPANSTKVFSITFAFSTDMDPASVTNSQNWTLSRANSTDAGYYNYSMPVTPEDVALPYNPEAVTYNSLTNEATISFRLNQNENSDAVIDPKHIVFRFNGKDALGREIDQTADEISGYSGDPF
jgi:tetratricopeptide (TPR) repeat protein